MKLTTTLLAWSLFALAANPAFAQDDRTTPAAAFSGMHVEASFGWDHINTKSIKDIDATAGVTGGSDGVTYGGALGYDFALTTNLTLGGELGLNGSSAKWNNTTNLNTGTFNTATVNPGRDIYIGARIGYAISPQTLFFGKAGYTNARLAVTGTDGTNTLNLANNEDGWRLGAGTEQKLTKATYVKLEYDFSHYGSGQFNYAGLTPDSSNFDLHHDRHQIVASVGLRF